MNNTEKKIPEPPKPPSMRIQVNGMTLTETEYEEYKKLNIFQKLLYSKDK